MGTRPQPSLLSPGCQPQAQLYFPICGSLRSLLLLKALGIWGFGLIDCKRSRGVGLPNWGEEDK